jgi:outer membrane protein
MSTIRCQERVIRTPQALMGGLIAAACAVSAVCSEPASAQEMKLGYVNVAKVFEGYQRTKASEAALEQRGKQKEAELEARMNELKKLRQSLELLNEDARDAKAREIDEKTEELQRFRNTTARDLGRERDRSAREILKSIQDAVDQVAKAGGYSLVLDSRSLLYATPAQDVTNEVLKVLNSQAGGKPKAQ